MYSVVLSLLLLALSRTTTAATSAADLDAEGYLPPSNRVDEDDASRNVRGRRLQPCLNSWDVRTPDGCNFDALVSIMNSQLPPPPCGHSMEEELMAIFGLTLTQTRVAVDEMCLQAMADKELREGVTFGEILMQDNDVYPKAYFDGGTYLNEARETIDAQGLSMDHQSALPNTRINSVYNQAARYNTRIIFPDETMSNFQECELRAAMCCWTQDRQDDNDGNCDTPYDQDCVDADPGDNTDVCYVDLERSPESNRVRRGITVFDEDAEGDVHCHGFAWSNNANEPSALFKGANLFFVSMYDHLGIRGYVRNVPGAPMCGCVDQMPTVSESDCTEIELIKQQTGYSYQPGIGLNAFIGYTEVKFNDCRGVGNQINDLRSHYRLLADQGRASEDEFELFSQYVVGEGQCPEAIERFMEVQGWRRN